VGGDVCLAAVLAFEIALTKQARFLKRSLKRSIEFGAIYPVGEDERRKLRETRRLTISLQAPMVRKRLRNPR
jgi:hypothetical protein